MALRRWPGATRQGQLWWQQRWHMGRGGDGSGIHCEWQRVDVIHFNKASTSVFGVRTDWLWWSRHSLCEIWCGLNQTMSLVSNLAWCQVMMS
jgi:hypothetical protein